MPILARPRRLALAVASALSLAAAAGCKPTGQKASIGPLTADRYEATGTDGGRVDCYIFGADSNKPARLCGSPTPTSGFAGVFFNAVAVSPESKFVSAFGAPLEPGYYLIKALGTNSVDTWGLGKLPFFYWLGSGKLVGIEKGADHRTRVRLIDPAARAETVLDAGLLKSESWLPVPTDNDVALLFLAKLGAEEAISLRDPLHINSTELTVVDLTDERAPGNKRLLARGELERRNGGVFRPTAAVTSALAFTGGKWLFEGQPLGPFLVPAK